MNELIPYFASTGWLEWCRMPHQLQVISQYNIDEMDNIYV